jgi:16S rRNA (cytosine1402-N4)-methyltransferase
MIHRTVLLNEAINLLDIKKGDFFVDGTLGNGGHTELVAKTLPDVKIVAIDLDRDAIERSRERLKDFKNITFVEGNFENIDEILSGLSLKADKILLDVGLSSNQLEESGRGFSFSKVEPLKMSFKKDLEESDFDAYRIVNFWDEDSLRTIIKHYGEEKFAGRIARGIVKTRILKKLETTEDLVNVILANTPKFYHHGRIHPATRTFQAIRIAVNNELQNLENCIIKSMDVLNSKGRIAVISFHSLEDRIVKNNFKEMENLGLGTRVTKKPVVPKEEEIENNPRSRSAKLRVFEKK